MTQTTLGIFLEGRACTNSSCKGCENLHNSIPGPQSQNGPVSAPSQHNEAPRKEKRKQTTVKKKKKINNVIEKNSEGNADSQTISSDKAPLGLAVIATQSNRIRTEEILVEKEKKSENCSSYVEHSVPEVLISEGMSEEQYNQEEMMKLNIVTLAHHRD
eukprot:GHVR01044627.1.p1 GENE.GHVR01044627.1~~GHVR01044627.1.p1  ORF type:complete len:159 (+),score=15.86 GHVR01044627.1:113-589(+)